MDIINNPKLFIVTTEKKIHFTELFSYTILKGQKSQTAEKV